MVQFLKQKRYAYQKQAIKDGGSFTTEELLQETQRLGRLMNRRLERLERRYPRAEVLEDYKKAPDVSTFVNDRGEVNMSKISSQLQEEYRFLSRKTTTITGYERQLKRSISSFNKLFAPKDAEGNIVGKIPKYFNKENIFDLFDFLRDYRKKNENQIQRPSEEILDAIDEAERIHMDINSLLKNMSFWHEHLEDMKNFETPEGDGVFDSDYFKDLLRNK